MDRRLPNLRGMQAFEAAARLGSITRAAGELNLTHGAVSHRVRLLEEELGVRLFTRQARGVALTATGRQYLSLVGEAFDMLSRASDQVRWPDPSRPLTVSITESIGARWLVPRLDRFRAEQPGIDVALLTTPRPVDLVGGEADLALRYGLGKWEGVRARLLLRFDIFPVCAPRIAREVHPIERVEDLARHTLIRTEHDEWPRWLEAAGAADLTPANELYFSHYSLALAAALNGQGVAIGFSDFIELELDAGYLLRPLAQTVPSALAYYVVTTEQREADPRVRAFRDWILAETKTRARRARPPVSTPAPDAPRS